MKKTSFFMVFLGLSTVSLSASAVNIYCPQDVQLTVTGTGSALSPYTQTQNYYFSYQDYTDVNPKQNDLAVPSFQQLPSNNQYIYGSLPTYNESKISLVTGQILKGVFVGEAYYQNMYVDCTYFAYSNNSSAMSVFDLYVQKSGGTIVGKQLCGTYWEGDDYTQTPNFFAQDCPVSFPNTAS